MIPRVSERLEHGKNANRRTRRAIGCLCTITLGAYASHVTLGGLGPGTGRCSGFDPKVPSHWQLSIARRRRVRIGRLYLVERPCCCDPLRLLRFALRCREALLCGRVVSAPTAAYAPLSGLVRLRLIALSDCQSHTRCSRVLKGVDPCARAGYPPRPRPEGRRGYRNL
jgi:hypothetical protein